jgi:acetyl/propionyl-CoA carboxylase alpha subunit
VTDEDTGTVSEIRVVSAGESESVLRLGRRRLHVAGVALGERRQLWIDGRTLAFRREMIGGRHEAPVDLSYAATIPAVVLEILVEPGEHVEAGRKLILLESMKMVMPIVASGPGKVRAILCREGEAVAPGNPLVELEEEDGTRGSQRQD